MGRAGFPILMGLAALAAGSARADTFVADLGSAEQWDLAASSQGAWNAVDARIQAPVAANGVELDFGDGSDGDFADGPARAGITVVNDEITVDTDVHPVLNFKSFSLGHGKTLKATGAHPLTIKVLGAAQLVGTVDLSGVGGTANSSIGPTPGGQAGVGGGRGGNGGFGSSTIGFSTQSTAGSPAGPGPAVGGGNGPNQTAPSPQHGGGGGCNGETGGHAASPGDSDVIGAGGAAASCTLAPADVASAFETSFSGGAGGGGGGAYLTPTPQASGAGGGGGGGAFRLCAMGAIRFTDSLAHTGTILVAGGDGGSNEISDPGQINCGGGGGGGSGGSVWLQSGTSIEDGNLLATGGSGWVNTQCGGSFNGGDGSPGVVRVDRPSGAAYPGAHLNRSVAIKPSTVYIVVSRPIHIPYGYAALGSPTETFDTASTGCGTSATTVTYEGSMDGTTFEHPVPKERISELNDYPYLRFKATLDTTGGTPACLTGLSIPFGPRELADLRLSGGLFCGSIGGARGRDAGGGPRPFEALGDLLMIGLAGLVARAARSGPRAARP